MWWLSIWSGLRRISGAEGSRLRAKVKHIPFGDDRQNGKCKSKARRIAGLLVEEAFCCQPFGEAVDPLIGGDVLDAHAEAVAAFGIHVQLG